MDKLRNNTSTSTEPPKTATNMLQVLMGLRASGLLGTPGKTIKIEKGIGYFQGRKLTRVNRKAA